jgi:hypothetical protein
MAIGFDCSVYRGGTVVYEMKKHPRFPRIEGGEQLVHLGWHSNNRGYDSDLMGLFGWLISKRVETINLSGYPCLFSVFAGWLRAYGIVIPDDVPNDEPL